MQASIYQRLPDGITCIDTGYYRDELAACYLIEHAGRAAFVDTGTQPAVPRLLQLLENRKLPLDAVDYIIPTHVHLDHAGGAGELMRRMPNAKLVIHPRGARHMIDPSVLEVSAMSVYGEADFKNMFGELIPVPEERIISAPDNFELDFNGRRLLIRDTPGHARHHFCIYDELSGGFFAGDTFGISYRELDTDVGAFILPTTTPVQFEPEAWLSSLDMLMQYQPRCMYLTHYGKVEDVARLATELRKKISRYAGIALIHRGKNDSYQNIKKALQDMAVEELRQAGSCISADAIVEFLDFDLELNTQGLLVWLEKRRA